jgi:phospholipase/lecithinase/hemolysin
MQLTRGLNARFILFILIALFTGLGIGYFLGIRNSQLPSMEVVSSSVTPSSDPAPLSTVAPPLETALPVEATDAGSLNVGIGIMGDSNSDEYRANDARGGEFSDTTLNWMEQLVLNRHLNFGEWGKWSEPRRTGYEYNWARTGATAASLIEEGQHTGLAQQVEDGNVSIVFLWIGDNDFHLTNGTYDEIYDGSLSEAEIELKINRFVDDVTTAVDTVLAAGDVQMVIVTVLDQGLAPEAAQRFPKPEGRQRVTDAINTVNDRLKQLAESRNIAVADMTGVSSQIFRQIDTEGFLDVGGEKITILQKGDDPHFSRLDDKQGHAGTVVSGLLANFLFVEPLNNSYGLEITPLSEEEILKDAGLR